MMRDEFDYRRGFPVDADAEPDAPIAKAPYIDHGTGLIDPKIYYDPDRARDEWERMWTKTWTFAGYAFDVAKVGDYFKYDLGTASIIVVRSSETEIRALHNVCPHRGNRIVTEPFGTVRSCFHCSFHGWEFSLEGKVERIRDEELFRPGVISDRPGLDPVRCEVWKGLVFVSLNPDVPPLEEFLDVLPEHLKAYPLEDYRAFRDLELEWDANWKTAEDAFLEFYHADDVHPEVLPMTEVYRVQYDLYKNGHSRMIIPIGLPNKFTDGTDGNVVIDLVHQTLRGYGGDPSKYAPGELEGTGFKRAYTQTKRDWAERMGFDYFKQLSDSQVSDDWVYSIFPNITINVFADSILIQRFLPHPTDPNKSIYSTQTLALPVPDPDHEIFDINLYGPNGNGGPKGWDGTVRPPREQVTDFEQMGYVLAQDARLVPQIQKGIRSPNFKGTRLNESEIRIRHYLAEIDNYLSGQKSFAS